jgi:PAS domain S-box-containing protein
MTTMSAVEYRTIVEHSPFMIWRADATAKCNYFNERWLAFTGRTLADELGDGWTSGVHAEDLDRCLATYRTAFARRAVFAMEYRLRRHDGEYRWVHDCGAPVHDADDRFEGYVGSCVDVTERVVAEQERTRAHAVQVTRLLQLLPICAWCKKVRDDQGYWSDVERYLKAHLDTDITHAMCPECQQRHWLP